MNVDKNCLTYWLPFVCDIPLAPVPRTKFMKYDLDLHMMLDGNTPEGYDDFADGIREMILSIGMPCFLRTGLTSAKHSWKDSCYVTDINRIDRHIYELVEYSACAGFWGLATDVWVAREVIKTTPAFHAFYGQMPITKERRYFIENEKVLYHNPYWPEESIKAPSCDDWQKKLKKINQESEAEVRLLTFLSKEVSKRIEGAWSVDWLQSEEGVWYLTDMAVAEQSYGYKKELHNK